ncbi:MAG: aminotransferase class IV family protein [Bacteroidia bacterium]|nr:aminotransferase class IV family protein [Bacteroidia bacterium]
MSLVFQVNYNGNLLSADSPVLRADNRSFRYGDGVFETIRHANGKPQFLAHHVARLKSSLEVLHISFPPALEESSLRSMIVELSARNAVERGGRIRLTVFRKEGGYYTPDSNEGCFLLECDPIDESNYNLNPAGLVVDIFPDFKKQVNKLSSIKSNNAQVPVLAALYKKQNELDDCIILNSNFSIAEAINANVFAVKNGVLYTPPIADGCVDGIMRKQVIHVAKQNRISVYEVSLAMNVLLNSDELFLTNVVSGISWISAYKAKRFTNTMSKMLVEKLNESLE